MKETGVRIARLARPFLSCEKVLLNGEVREEEMVLRDVTDSPFFGPEGLSAVAALPWSIGKFDTSGRWRPHPAEAFEESAFAATGGAEDSGDPFSNLHLKVEVEMIERCLELEGE